MFILAIYIPIIERLKNCKLPINKIRDVTPFKLLNIFVKIFITNKMKNEIKNKKLKANGLEEKDIKPVMPKEILPKNLLYFATPSLLSGLVNSTLV